MVGYAKLKNSHLTEITEDMRRRALEQNNIRRYGGAQFYTAEVISGTLAITTYSLQNLILTAEYRHFYNKEQNAHDTQRIVDGGKLHGTISNYLGLYNWYGARCVPLDDVSDKVICDYLGGGISNLDRIERDILREKNNAKYRKIADRTDKVMAPIGVVPPEFTDWWKNIVLGEARYFFYKYKRGTQQEGYCSHCKHVFSAKVSHNSVTICPNCNAKLVAKSLGKITKYTIDNRAQVIYIQPFGDKLIERVFEVYQKICNQHLGADKCEVQIGIFEHTRNFYDAKSLSRDKGYYFGTLGTLEGLRWVPEACGQRPVIYYNKWIYPENIDSIVKNSDEPAIKNIETSAIVTHISTDFFMLIQTIKRSPGVENLVKQGHYKLAQQLFDRYVTYGMNAQAITCTDITGLDKQTLRELGDISPNDYNFLLRMRSVRPISVEIFRKYLSAGLGNLAREEIIDILRRYRIGAERLINYIVKQAKICKEKPVQAVSIYNDYLSMTRDLRLPKTDSVIFPQNVRQEHDRLMGIKTELEYSEQNKKLRRRAKILEQLDYDNGVYCIRAFRCARDFLTESSVLGHCVKTYINRCAAGETNIYGIRRSADPDKPYFTLTLSNDAKVTQNLGKSNCQPPKEILEFVREWERKVISKKKKEFIAAVALLERFDDTEEREKYRSALQKVAQAIAASLK